MHKIYHEDNYKEQILHCEECGWEGTGKETLKEHLYLSDAIELYCPHCKNYLGFVNQENH